MYRISAWGLEQGFQPQQNFLVLCRSSFLSHFKRNRERNNERDRDTLNYSLGLIASLLTLSMVGDKVSLEKVIFLYVEYNLSTSSEIKKGRVKDEIMEVKYNLTLQCQFLK